MSILCWPGPTASLPSTHWSWPGDGFAVASLVHDEAPGSLLRPGRPEVLEVEGEDGQVVPLRERHHGGIGETQVEVGVSIVDLHRAPQQLRGQECRGDLLGRQRLQKQASDIGTE